MPSRILALLWACTLYVIDLRRWTMLWQQWRRACLIFNPIMDGAPDPFWFADHLTDVAPHWIGGHAPAVGTHSLGPFGPMQPEWDPMAAFRSGRSAALEPAATPAVGTHSAGTRWMGTHRMGAHWMRTTPSSSGGPQAQGRDLELVAAHLARGLAA